MFSFFAWLSGGFIAFPLDDGGLSPSPALRNSPTPPLASVVRPQTPYYGGTPRLGRRGPSAGQAAGPAIVGRFCHHYPDRKGATQS